MSPALKIAVGALVVWEPLNFAAALLRVWPTLTYRSWTAVAELAMHGIIAAICAAAGVMLLNGTPDARRMARLAVVLSVGRVIYSTYWSELPSQIVPGDRLFYTVVAVAAGGVALLILRAPSERPSR